MHLAARSLLASLALLGLAGCSAFAPFETVPPPLPSGQTSTVQRVAVCYISFAASPAQVQAIAAEGCGANMTPQFVDEGISLTFCPTLIPIRATFACNPSLTPEGR